MAKPLPSSWAELPDDILGQVLLRLPSLDDRVRLRAVFRPWRAGAAAQRHPRLPPPLPWLALRDGTLVDLHGAPSDARPSSARASSTTSPSTTWPSSCTTTVLAAAVRRAMDESRSYNKSDARKEYVKVILSSPLDSTRDPLVAVLIMEGHGLAISAGNQCDAISICLIPHPKRTRGLESVEDIAFLHGKLYALTLREGLHVIELDASHLLELNSSSTFHQCITDDPKQQQIYNTAARTGPECVVIRYLVESGGRLLMVRRWMIFPQNARLGDHDKTSQIEVFEADLTTIPGCWIKVDSLGGHVGFNWA
ncbi:hypothetical protein ACP70R_018060 [Stipagrostis hirtigluma subsp. patula]